MYSTLLKILKVEAYIQKKESREEAIKREKKEIKVLKEEKQMRLLRQRENQMGQEDVQDALRLGDHRKIIFKSPKLRSNYMVVTLFSGPNRRRRRQSASGDGKNARHSSG